MLPYEIESSLPFVLQAQQLLVQLELFVHHAVGTGERTFRFPRFTAFLRGNYNTLAHLKQVCSSLLISRLNSTITTSSKLATKPIVSCGSMGSGGGVTSAAVAKRSGEKLHM